jgi:hypothetical protein
MVKNIMVFMVCMTLNGCATKRSSKLYAGIAGAFVLGTVGAIIGQEASPNKESDTLNALMGATVGAGIGGLLGSYTAEYFHEQSPENRELKNMIHNKKPSANIPLNMNGGLGGLQISTKGVPVGTETLPVTDIPDYMKKYIKKSQLTEYNIEEQAIQYGDKTMIIPEFKIYEQTFEE